ncbi:OB-fold putative lipoprotein [Saprospiraceae bacterium]|nr:OB-fold putative lipoprotein [Saprospiraceae bacterium]
MKKLLYFILALFIIAIIAYFVVLNLPKASIKGNDAAFTITAIDLYADFEKNENQANRKYIGKTIVVEGTISEIDKDKNGATVLFINSANDMNGILCTLEQGQKGDFQENQTIKIKGLCTGFLQDVVLNKCVIVD